MQAGVVVYHVTIASNGHGKLKKSDLCQQAALNALQEVLGAIINMLKNVLIA